MNKKYLYIAATGLMGLTGLASCSLDEYNPEAGSATIENFNTWKGLQVTCYSSLYHELYSKDDFLFLSECGTDLWLNPALGYDEYGVRKDYAGEAFYYKALGVASKQASKPWLQAYSAIATCNTVINNAGNVEGGDPAVINTLVAEAKCLRAFMHLTLTTYFGPIPLCTNVVGEVNLAPQRNSLDEVYASIISDLREAASVLDVEPYDGNYARVCKKTALGLLARAYAQGAAEGLTEDGVSYWQRAKEVSEDMINNAAAYGMYLYKDVDDLWAVDNNRANKEALFIAAGLDATGSDANMAGTYLNARCYLYAYTRPDPTALTGLFPSKINSRDMYEYLGTMSQAGVMAPSKHAIDVFDEQWDKRYENTFMTAFGLYTLDDVSGYDFDGMTVTLEESRRNGDVCAIYNIDKNFEGRKIRPYAALAKVTRTGGQQLYAKGIYKKGSTSGAASNIVSTKNPMVIEMPLAEDEDRFPIYLSKADLSDADKAKRGYFCMNISDLYDAEGNYINEPFVPNPGYAGDGKEKTDANKMFPALLKYNWLFDGVMREASGETRNGDIYIMRAAEIYLIAAEANVMLGNPGDAARYLKTVRDRASRTGVAPALDNPTEQDILDEYAREFCGEHMRWAVLKRHRESGLMNYAIQNYNKEAAKYFKESVHYWRPIPQTFLDQIENAQEFGDNGYGYTVSKGF